MARPKRGYGKTDAGMKYVGVTTPLGLWGDKGGMIHAAWKLGMEGENYREIWHGAANAGTLAHELVDAYLHDKPEPDMSMHLPEIVGKAETAYLGFLQWATLVNFKVIMTEQSLYDEVLGLAGTPDLAAIQGKRCIIDWKTSKVIYPEYWAQVSAYKYLWEATYPDQPIEECYILQLNKEDGGFAYHHKPNLAPYWEFYCHVLAAYRLYKEKLGG